MTTAPLPGSPAASGTAAGMAGGPALASRGMRLSAAGLDGVIGMLVLVPAMFSMTSALARMFILNEPFAWTTAMSASCAISGLLMFALCVITWILVARHGQTIGKKTVGIRVVRSDGSKASLGRIFWLRNVVNMVPSLVPLVGSVYTLVDLLWIFGERQRCLHDLIADTLVIRA